MDEDDEEVFSSERAASQDITNADMASMHNTGWLVLIYAAAAPLPMGNPSKCIGHRTHNALPERQHNDSCPMGRTVRQR